jgi:hypothetical protein
MKKMNNRENDQLDEVSTKVGCLQFLIVILIFFNILAWMLGW